MKTKTSVALLTCLISCNLFALNHHGTSASYIKENYYRNTATVPYFDKGVWFDISGLYLKSFNENSKYNWDNSVEVGTLVRGTGNDIRFMFSHYDLNNLRSSPTLSPVDNKINLIVDSEIGLMASGSVNATVSPSLVFVESLTTLPISPTVQQMIVDLVVNDITTALGITDTTTLTLQSTSQITFALPADFSLTINPTLQSFTCDSKVNTFDLDVGQYLNLNPRTQVRFFGGLRYLKLEQHLTETFGGSAAQSQLITTTSDLAFDGILGDEATATAVILIPDLITLSGVTTTATFDGTAALQTIIQQRNKTDAIGPRIGADLSYRLRGGFEITGRCAGALLVGHRDSTLDSYNNLSFATSLSSPSSTLTGTVSGPAEIDNVLNLIDVQEDLASAVFEAVDSGAGGSSSVTTEIDTHYKAPNKNNLIPNIDLKLGVKYNFGYLNNRQPHLTVEAGYFGTYYFDAINELRLDGDFENPGQRLINRSFAGPYLSLAVVL